MSPQEGSVISTLLLSPLAPALPETQSTLETKHTCISGTVAADTPSSKVSDLHTRSFVFIRTHSAVNDDSLLGGKISWVNGTLQSSLFKFKKAVQLYLYKAFHTQGKSMYITNVQPCPKKHWMCHVQILTVVSGMYPDLLSKTSPTTSTSLQTLTIHLAAC